ncbi:3'5'-cyclic nucleotide phosphodiesterase domain-containing protein [Toxoplasma gondii VAND]|uniref:Phosphodiesterase n=1 Tax=Toxoplasma gondii VAND TaxID=933077 RepID=A0A086PS54_TOXGO|nr:3'5'-cyclic nucleotide phosphodiesterase domain-containing protein [Toxoplasma gondii VAND]
MAELPPRRRRSSLIRLEENCDSLSGFGTRPSRTAPVHAVSPRASPLREEAAVSPTKNRDQEGLSPLQASPSTNRVLNTLWDPAGRETEPFGDLVEKGRTRREREEQDRRQSEGERRPYSTGRKTPEDGGDGCYTAHAGYSPGSLFASPGLPFYNEREQERRRRASRRIGAVGVDAQFYGSIGQQLRALQVACDRQKAEALRAPVEVACSAEASMISFGRSVAGTLSAALGCPLVFVCAYDKETDELYCCFTSLPLGLLCPPSSPDCARSRSPASGGALALGVDSEETAPAGAARRDVETLASRESSLQTSSRVSSPLRLPPSHLARVPSETAAECINSHDHESSGGVFAGAYPQLSPALVSVPPGPSAYLSSLPAQLRLASARQMGLVSSTRRDSMHVGASRLAAAHAPAETERMQELLEAPTWEAKRENAEGEEKRTDPEAVETEEVTNTGDEEANRGHEKTRGMLNRVQDKWKAQKETKKEDASGRPDNRQLHAMEGGTTKAALSCVWPARKEKQRSASEIQQRGSMSSVDLEDAEADGGTYEGRQHTETGAEEEGSVLCGRLDSAEEVLVHQLHQFLRWRFVDDRRASNTASFAWSAPPEPQTVSPRKAERHSIPCSSGRVAASRTSSLAPLPSPARQSGLAGAMMERHRKGPPSPFHIPRWECVARATSVQRLEAEDPGTRTRCGEGRAASDSPRRQARVCESPLASPEEELPVPLRYVSDPVSCDDSFDSRSLEGPEVLVLSPHVGCIGELFQNASARTTQTFLYNPESDAIIWPRAGLPSPPPARSLPQSSSVPLETNACGRGVSGSSSPTPSSPSLTSSSASSAAASFVSMREPADQLAAQESDFRANDFQEGAGVLEGATAGVERAIDAGCASCSPLRLLVRQLRDQTGSRLWELMEESRIDYSSPSERKRGPVADGPFGRRSEAPSSSSLPRSLAPHTSHAASLSSLPAESTLPRSARKSPSSSSSSAASAERAPRRSAPTVPRSPSVSFSLPEAKETISGVDAGAAVPGELATRAARPNFPMGLLVCVQPLHADCQGQEELIDEVADRIEQLLLSVLYVEWLKRERTKKALQLELHRSVFQEALNPIKTVERFLSLIHTTLGVEQAAFFIVDAQNNSFVCLGGALKARGLTLPYSHPLLGEATRQGGRIAICNDVPPCMNGEYDDLARIRTQSAMVVPLLNAQGFVKGVLLLMNRSACALAHSGGPSCLSASSGLASRCFTPPSTAPPPRPPLRHAASSPLSLCRHQNSGVSCSSSPALSASPFFLRSVPRAPSFQLCGALSESVSFQVPRGSSPRAKPNLRGRLGSSDEPTGGREERGRTRGDRRSERDRSGACLCALCSPAARQQLSYGDQLLQTLTVPNELKVFRKFTREDEVFLRCIQCEIQNALGGALTNVCVAGMTLLKPMVTMVSYVVAEPDSSVIFRSQTGADHVLAEIKTIVEEDKRQLLRRLRRCQSLAPSMDELGSRSLPSWSSLTDLKRNEAAEKSRKPGDGEPPAGLGRGRNRERAAIVEDSRLRPVSPPFHGFEAMAQRRGRERENDRRRRERDTGRAKDSEEEKQRRSTVSGPRPDGVGDALGENLLATRLSPMRPLGPFGESPGDGRASARGPSDAGPFSLPSSYSVDTEEESLSSPVSRPNRSEAGDSPPLVSGIRRKREKPGLLTLQSMGDFCRRQGREREEEDDRSVSSSANWWREEGGRSGDLTGRGNSDEMLRVCSVSSAEGKEDGQEEEGEGGGQGGAKTDQDALDGAHDQVPGRKAKSHAEASTHAHAYRRKGLDGSRQIGRTFGSSEDRFSPACWKGLKRRKRASSVPSLVFSAALEKCERHMKAIRKDLVLAQFRGWNLDIWRRNSSEMEIFFLLALDDLGLLERREEKKLRHFFAIIRDGYHTDNPYHNFYHAIHVFQVCWMFLSAYGCRNILSPIEQLGILLAALCHDVDHPGVNNAFLRASLHPLSIMYNDKSVLENHHAAFAIRTMMQLGMYGAGSRIFPSGSGAAAPASPDGKSGSSGSRFEGRIVPSFSELRKIVIQAIFSTDMELFRQHHDAMKRRAQMKTNDREELEGEDDRNLLVTCLIHCADICNPVMSEGRNVQWASLVTQEFNAQVDLERRYGLPVSVFMDARTELQRTQSQIGFLSFVVLDQFRALADLIPEVSELVVQGEKNLEMWQRALDTLKAAAEAEKAGERYEDLPSNFSFRLKDLKFVDMRGVKCFGFIQCEEFDGYRPPSLDV